MNRDLEQAKQLLQQPGCTCAFCREEAVYTCHSRGIRPLVDFLDSGVSLRGFSCADRVVGRAAAYLYYLLGIHALHAGVMSREAAAILAQAGIACSCDAFTDSISNRKGDGPCPMEAATKLCRTPEQALLAVRQALQALSS